MREGDGGGGAARFGVGKRRRARRKAREERRSLITVGMDGWLDGWRIGSGRSGPQRKRPGLFMRYHWLCRESSDHPRPRVYEYALQSRQQTASVMPNMPHPPPGPDAAGARGAGGWGRHSRCSSGRVPSIIELVLSTQRNGHRGALVRAWRPDIAPGLLHDMCSCACRRHGPGIVPWVTP